MKARLAIIHLGFVLTGIVTTMLGPILPLLSSRWLLTDSQAGRLFTAQFLSSVTGSLLASRIVGRWGAATTVTIGMFLVVLGVVLLGIGSLTFGVAGIALYGLGLGFALPSTNLWVSELAGEKASSALNLLNFSWTVGALGAPMFFAELQRPLGSRGTMFLLAASLLVIAILEAAGVRHQISGPPREIQSSTAAHERSRLILAILTTLFLLLYVGTENGIAGWLPSFATRNHQMSVSSTAILQSCFWGCILLGRLLAPVVLRRVASNTLVVAGLAAAAIGTAIAVMSPNVPALFGGVVLGGLGLSSLFPTVASIFTRWYGTGGGGSIVLGVGGLGGAFFPWLVGLLTYRSGSLRFGFSLNLLTALLAALVFWRINGLVQTKFSRAKTNQASAAN